MSDTRQSSSGPIRVGDRFRTTTGIWKVIETKPGGKVELFCESLASFQSRYTREVHEWERVS